MEGERTLEALRELVPVLAVLVMAGAGVFACLGVLAFAHIKARLILDFYQELGRQIQKDEALAKTGAELPHLPRFHELHGMMRELLEREGVLRKPAAGKKS